MKIKPQLIYIVVLAAFIATARAQTDAPASGGAAAPPSAPPQLSQADLEKLVAPIALYPDPLLATLLPASAYPLDIVKAARFIADTNNIPKIDSQPWDPNVKALARFPEVIQKMNDDLDWTSSLGDAFADNQKSVMDAIQSMRNKAEQAGNLKTTPEQVVTVTNTIVQETVNQQVVTVTNTVVQIAPASTEVIYVPTYNPTVVYAAPAPGAVAAASFMSFGMGMMWGAAINNNCDWNHGDIDVNHNYNRSVNRNVNRTVNGNTRNVNGNVNANNRNVNANSRSTGTARQNTSGNTGGQQKWQPDPNRRETSQRSSPASSGWSGSNTSGQRDAFNNSGSASQTRNASQRGATSRSGGQYSGAAQRSAGQPSAGQRSGGQRFGGQSGGGGRRSGGGGRGRR